VTVTDPARWRDLADVIASGTGIGGGDRVMIALTDHEAYPAVEALVALTIAAGAYPQVQLVDERFDRALLVAGSEEQVGWVPELEAWGMEWADVYVAVRGLLAPTSDVPAKADRLAALRAAKGQISTLRWQHTRWSIVRVPTASWADYLGVDLGILLGEFFAACTLDWAAHRPSWEQLSQRLASSDQVRIRDASTDLTFSVRGRPWVVFAGECNLPDGEMATAPVTSTVTGHITFDAPFVFAGQRIADLRLEFEHGSVVSVEASEGAAVARALVSTDEGAARIGEFGVGLNPHLRRWTQDLFFDEKVLGTVHIALGRAYPECGGDNRSSLHWDIVKDLRPRDGHEGGDVHVDGEPLLRAGDPCWLADETA
jgi:aminopeptidase